MDMHQIDSNKEVLQELEFLQAGLELLRQEVDCISQDMKPLRLLHNTMDKILSDLYASR